MITPEDLSAYLDGEAPDSKVRDIEAALQVDAGLRGKIDRMQAKDREIKAAMDSLLERPVPDRLAEAVRASLAATGPQPQNDNVVALKPRLGWTSRALWPTAIAAALVGGVMIGQVLPLRTPDAVEWTSDRSTGVPMAGKAIAAALSTATSGAHVTLAANRTMTPVMTFASRDGSLCRQFELAEPAGRQNGLACRGDRAAWRLVALASTGVAASAGGYRTASGAGEDAVSAMADRLIKGEPMDATAEAAALRSR
ncbi:MAG TPA: hypothetical protein VHN39_16525 [Phenylobacterium sp.]|jgi:hypothetical protein|nr:hypothetical protein [Phenylobacterium sp.]